MIKFIKILDHDFVVNLNDVSGILHIDDTFYLTYVDNNQFSCPDKHKEIYENFLSRLHRYQLLV